jgi:hypothetical protein
VDEIRNDGDGADLIGEAVVGTVDHGGDCKAVLGTRTQYTVLSTQFSIR